MKYLVGYDVSASGYWEFEAESADEAKRMAEEKIDATSCDEIALQADTKECVVFEVMQTVETDCVAK